MACTDETIMKKTIEKHKGQVMDGEMYGQPKPDEAKSGKKMKHPRATHLKTSESGMRNSGKMEGETEKQENRKREQREGERKTKLEKRGKGKGEDVLGDGGMPAEKRARTGSGDENGQDVKESQVIKKSRGQEDSKVVKEKKISVTDKQKK